MSRGNNTGNNLFRTYGDQLNATQSEAVMGENMTIGDWVYMADAPGLDVFIGDATDPLKPYHGVTVPNLFHLNNGDAGLTGEPVNVCWAGEILLSGLSPGQVYYADPANPGGITKVKPTGIYQMVGLAITAERFFVAIQRPTGDGDDSLPVYDTDQEAKNAGYDIYLSGEQHESLPYGVKKRVHPAIVAI